MRARLGLLLVFFALLSPAAAQPNARGVTPAPPDFPAFRDEDKIAVLVGIDNYPATSGLGELHYATKDASELWQVLKKQGYKTPLTEKDPVLLNAEANKTAIKKTVKAALDSLQGKGTFLFFFAGHGVEKNGKQYLAPREVDKDDLESSALSMDDLLKIVKDSPVQRKVLFIDACREQGTRSAETEWFSHVAEAQGMQIMYASGPNLRSHEDSDYQHGVFTYYLLKALGGDAAIRGVVSFTSVQNYLTAHLKSDPKALGQLPHVNSTDTTQGGDLLLAGTLIEIDLPGEFSNQQIMAAGKRYYLQEAIKSAGDYYRQKKFVEAAESVRVALSLDPRSDEAYWWKTLITLASVGQAAGAEVCDQRLKIAAEAANQVLFECAEAFEEPYPEQALQYIEKIPAAARRGFEYVRLYNKLLDRTNRLDTLSSSLESEDLSDLSREPIYSLFESYVNALKRTGQAGKAETILTAQIARFDKPLPSVKTRGIEFGLSDGQVLKNLYSLRAEVRVKQNRLVPALLDYSVAISNSSDALTRAHRCWLLADLGLEAEALDDCGKIESLNNAFRLFAVGEAYSRLGKPQQAIEQFSAAMKSGAGDKELFDGRGYAYMLNGDFDKALPDFARSIELDPGFAWPHRDRALTLSRMGKNEEGLKDINEALRLDPYFAEAYAVRADIQRTLGHTADADKESAHAIQLGWKLNPKQP